MDAIDKESNITQVRPEGDLRNEKNEEASGEKWRESIINWHWLSLTRQEINSEFFKHSL